MVIETFDESPPLSPHNLAFVMGYIQRIGVTLVEDSKVVATFWSNPGIPRPLEIYLFDKLDPAVINLIDVFPIPYSLPKLDLVCLPPGIGESIAKPGLIAMK